MLNGINLNENIENSQLGAQMGVGSIAATNPIKNPYANIDRNLFIDETSISNEAVNLYQHEQDIKKFSALAMSDPNDLSHEQIIDSLFNKGVSDVLSDEGVSKVVNSQKFLDDISF